MRRLRFVPWLLALVLLAGCITVDVPVPKTPSQALAVLEVEYAAIKRAAAGMVDSGNLSGERLEIVAKWFVEIDEIRARTREAWDAGQSKEFDEWLAQFATVLIQIRREVIR